jgi:hypothetical protein
MTGIRSPQARNSFLHRRIVTSCANYAKRQPFVLGDQYLHVNDFDVDVDTKDQALFSRAQRELPPLVGTIAAGLPRNADTVEPVSGACTEPSGDESHGDYISPY